MVWTSVFRLAGLAVAFGLFAAPVSRPALAQQGGPVQSAPQTRAAPAPAPEAAPTPETPGDPNAPDSAPVLPVDVPERPALVIRGKSKWDEGFKSLTDAFSKLRAEADTAKLAANGRPLAVFVQSDDEGFTFEAMLPVEIDAAASPKLSEGITAGKSPGGQALKFEHRGAYDDIESTYEAIAAYLDEKGLSARDELIEEFVNETIGSDDTNLAVDIYVLLKP